MNIHRRTRMQKKGSLLQVNTVENVDDVKDIFGAAGVGAWAIEMEKNRILPFREPAYVEEGFQRSEGDAKAAIAIFI